MKKLDMRTFQCVVDNTPLVSIDFIVEYNGKILLGKRKNKPAKSYFFTPGGRIYKNEYIKNALQRIAWEELGIGLKNMPEFIGAFEHFYDDGFFEKTSTHYVNLAYKFDLESIDNLPKDQHESYRLFSVDELMATDLVHIHVKNYFEMKGKK